MSAHYLLIVRRYSFEVRQKEFVFVLAGQLAGQTISQPDNLVNFKAIPPDN